MPRYLVAYNIRTGELAVAVPRVPQAVTGPKGLDQVSVAAFDRVSNALRVNAMPTPGGSHTPGNADQVFASIFDPTTNAVRVNCILGCGGGGNSFPNQSANTIFRGPASGGPAQPSFGPLVGADLPLPSPSSLGGVQSFRQVAHQWLNSISINGIPVSSQPTFGDISGTLAPSQLPAPSAITLGGVQSAAQQAHQWLNSISTSGVPLASQPTSSDLSDAAALERNTNKNQANGYAGLDASSKLTGTQIPYGTTADTAAQGNDSRITGAEQTANRGTAGGYAPLDSSSKLPTTNLPTITATLADSSLEKSANKNQANGYAGLNASSQIATAQIPNLPESQVTNLTSDLGAKESAANKNQPSGYAGLDVTGKLAGSQIPYGTAVNTAAQGNDSRITGAEQTANRGTAGGYAPLDSSSKLPTTNLPTITATLADSSLEKSANKNQANGYAGLNASSQIATAQIPNLPESQVTNLTSDLGAKESAANKNQPSGYAGLDVTGKLAGSQIPYGTAANTAAQGNDSRITGAEQTANRGAAGGYAPLDSSSKLPTANLPTVTASLTDNSVEKTANKNQANGYAGLSTSLQIAASQMPSFGASGAGHAPGAVPDPGATAGTARFLREDQTWAVPAGGGGGGAPGGGATAVQYTSDGSTFAGDASSFSYTPATHALAVTGSVTGTGLNSTGSTAGCLTLGELPSNGTATVQICAPASVPASKTWTWPSSFGSSGQVLTDNGSGVLSWSTPSGSGPVLQTNGTSNSSQATFNLQNSSATNGLTLTATNTSGGNVQLGLSGTLTNAGLANSSVSFNGQAVALGSTGNVNSGAAVHSLALNEGNGSAITGLALDAHQLAVGIAGADPAAKTVPDCQDTAGNHLNYTQSTDTFTCGTSGGGGATPPPSVAVLGSNGSSQLVAATSHGVVGPLVCVDSSGSGTAQSCSTTPSFTPAAGDTIIYKTGTTNTGDLTINVNSSSAVTVRKWQGSANLAAGDLVAGVYVPMVYDGTYWEITTVGNAPSGTFSPGGDLSGTASNQTVIGIQTKPVDSTAPTVGKQLNWSASASKYVQTSPGDNLSFVDNGVSGSRLDFNGSDTSTIILREEFVGGTTSGTGQGGELGWAWQTIGGAPSITRQNGSYPHLGVYQVATTGVAGQGANFTLGGANGMLGNLSANTNWDVWWIFLIQQTSNNRVRIGLNNGGTAIVPTDDIALRFDQGLGSPDTYWTVETCAASACSTSTALGAGGANVTPDTNWHKLHIWSTTAGTVNFQLDSGQAATLSSNVPTASLTPGCVVVTNGSSGVNIQFDFFAFKMRGLNR